MRYLSVCSGIEAATCAWHSLGWIPAAFSEIEDFPCALLKHHYPDVPNAGDFTKIRGDEYGAVNLLVGGTPCQDFSVAGLRAGLDGERGGLTIEFARLAHRMVARARTEWLAWENVPGVLSIDNGEAFAIFLSALSGRVIRTPTGGWQNSGVVEGTAGTFGLAYRVLDAQYSGVPQRRRRVFVIGYLGDWRRSAAVLLERHSLCGYPAPSRKAGEKVAATITGGFGERGVDADQIANGNAVVSSSGHGGYGDGFGVLRALRANGGDVGPGSESLVLGFSDVSDEDGFGCLKAREEGGGFEGIVAQTWWDGSDNADALTTRCHQQYMPDKDNFAAVIAFDTTQITSKTNRSNPQSGDPCHTLAKGADAPAIAGYFSPRIIRNSETSNEVGIEDGEVADCLQTDGPGAVAFNNTGQGWWNDANTASGIRDMSASGDSKHSTVLCSRMAVRRLTPMECERLQGFPDNFTLIPYKGKMVSDGPRYKALGNSMAVPVMRWIGKRIQMVEELTKWKF